MEDHEHSPERGHLWQIHTMAIPNCNVAPVYVPQQAGISDILTESQIRIDMDMPGEID
jgi:hypothetical protein